MQQAQGATVKTLQPSARQPTSLEGLVWEQRAATSENTFCGENVEPKEMPMDLTISSHVSDANAVAVAVASTFSPNQRQYANKRTSVSCGSDPCL
jgi:hypothetical protein